MTPDLPPVPEVESALVEFVTERCEAVGVEVLHLGVQAHTLHGATVHWTGNPCQTRPELQLLVTRGDRLSELLVRPRLAITIEVPVAEQFATAGELVSIVRGTARIGEFHGRPVDDGEWLARTDLKPGTPLTDSVVMPPIHAHTGDAVEIALVRGALIVTASGTLLQSARIGDTVQVANRATGLAQRGVLVSAKRVEIH